MKTVYVYLKFTDNGYRNSILYWCNSEPPAEWLIKELKMENENPKYNIWFTTLENIGEAGFDLISIYPYRKAFNSTMISRIENFYIFKREETEETYLSHQGNSGD